MRVVCTPGWSAVNTELNWRLRISAFFWPPEWSLSFSLSAATPDWSFFWLNMYCQNGLEFPSPGWSAGCRWCNSKEPSVELWWCCSCVPCTEPNVVPCAFSLHSCTGVVSYWSSFWWQELSMAHFVSNCSSSSVRDGWSRHQCGLQMPCSSLRCLSAHSLVESNLGTCLSLPWWSPS